MKRVFLTGAIIAMAFMVHAQAPLTIDSCYAFARQQYPLIKQKGLIEKSKDYNVSNAGKGYLPQVSFNGQATYQSAVTTVPSIPGLNFTIPTVSKEQFNVHGEVDQTIYDGGVIKQQKQLQAANADVQEQNIEVQLYGLKDRVNQIFFGTLLIDQQLKQNELVQKDLQNSIDKMQANVDNGTALVSNLDELQANLLQQQENAIGLKAARKAYVEMLGLFINRPLDENAQLTTPPNKEITDQVRRPELSLYDFQLKTDDAQEKILNAAVRPKFMYFFQGGYALPGLNAFDTKPQPYYITGFRLSWSIDGLYKLNNQKQLLDIDRQTIAVQKENFLFNTNMSLKQQSNDILKLQQTINLDQEIIGKRTAIKNTAKLQLDNGVITVHDYISQLDAEDQANQNLLIHQVQLLMDEYNYQNITGN